ncbi:hypothetical protein EDC91_13444 [Shewanella fodinae]|uniref:Uncharacterized protein n=1 Tax=Shewanella fodinae TaxID=552357 RepID=A0A4R2F405_9GAMM|nr:hypothetical protein EDC91_13444 [Shewanella fodinae]
MTNLQTNFNGQSQMDWPGFISLDAVCVLVQHKLREQRRYA